MPGGKSATGRGAKIDTDPLRSFITSWRAIVLVILKAGLHWLAGQATSVRAGFELMGDSDPSPFESSFSLSATPSRWGYICQRPDLLSMLLEQLLLR